MEMELRAISLEPKLSYPRVVATLGVLLLH